MEWEPNGKLFVVVVIEVWVNLTTVVRLAMEWEPNGKLFVVVVIEVWSWKNLGYHKVEEAWAQLSI